VYTEPDSKGEQTRCAFLGAKNQTNDDDEQVKSETTMVGLAGWLPPLDLQLL